MTEMMTKILQSGKQWSIIFVGAYIVLAVLFATILGQYLSNWLKIAPDISAMIQWLCAFVGGGGAIKSIADVLPKIAEVLSVKKSSESNSGSNSADTKTTGV